MRATRYGDYRRAVLAGLTAYRRRQFAGRDTLFEPGPQGEITFRPEAAHRNFFDPALYHDLVYRPRSFRSMTSSRVLAISVLGTLARREDLGLLSQVLGDDRQPILAGHQAQTLTLELQRPAGLLGEVDICLSGPGLRLAVASRFLERGWGACPQPSRGRCDGNYVRREGAAQCWYSDHGVFYWRYLPAALGWDAQREYRPCPLRGPFGLVRALLAVAGDPGPALPGVERGLLLIYDGRNPAFAPGSRADWLFSDVRASLHAPFSLQRTTWQAIAAAMACSVWYSDLLGYLKVKYGIEACGARSI